MITILVERHARTCVSMNINIYVPKTMVSVFIRKKTKAKETPKIPFQHHRSKTNRSRIKKQPCMIRKYCNIDVITNAMAHHFQYWLLSIRLFLLFKQSQKKENVSFWQLICLLLFSLVFSPFVFCPFRFENRLPAK